MQYSYLQAQRITEILFKLIRNYFRLSQPLAITILSFASEFDYLKYLI